MIAMLTTLCSVSRIVVLPLPNVQPVTDTIMIITLIIGASDGFILAVLTMVVSNLYLGFGIWILPQIFAYGACVLLVVLFKKLTPLGRSHWLQIALCILLGFAYGFFVSLGMAVIGSAPAFFAYWLSGLLYDFYHAAGNVVLYPLLYLPLTKLLKNYNF